MRVDSTSLLWRAAKAGLWIATRPDGSAAGIVNERWNEGFQVTAADGRDLGTYPHLDGARSALERAERYAGARARLRSPGKPGTGRNRAAA